MKTLFCVLLTAATGAKENILRQVLQSDREPGASDNPPVSITPPRVSHLSPLH